MLKQKNGDLIGKGGMEGVGFRLVWGGFSLCTSIDIAMQTNTISKASFFSSPSWMDLGGWLSDCAILCYFCKPLRNG